MNPLLTNPLIPNYHRPWFLEAIDKAKAECDAKDKRIADLEEQLAQMQQRVVDLKRELEEGK